MAGRIGRNMMNGFCRALGGIALALLASSSTARAQTYPDRPVKIIVPIGPGGSYDLVGRHLADVLSRRTGQAFVVENKPGAGTVVGTQAASQSEPDGYTLMIGGLSNMAFNSALYSKLGYDPLKDFVPVALVYKFGYVMVGRKDLPQAKLQDIVTAAKANPGSISVATAGVGTGQQLVAAAFMKAAGALLGKIAVVSMSWRFRSPRVSCQCPGKILSPGFMGRAWPSVRWRGWPGGPVACRSRRTVRLRLWLAADRSAHVAPGKMGGRRFRAPAVDLAADQGWRLHATPPGGRVG
jgi:hypothetical protein